MREIDVALDPRDSAPAAVAVVVDCIRATTTIAHALAAGYARVVCVGEVEDAHAEAAAIGPGAVLGGERNGVLIAGFDLGNSPAEYAEPRGTALVLTTTNGTRAILQSVAESGEVLVGSLVCLDAVVRAVLDRAPRTVAVRCAGVRGRVALDDVYVAGRIVDALAASAPDAFLTDEARTARAIARGYATPLAALADAQSARDLDGTGHEQDVERCARVSILEVAPRVVESGAGRAVVTR